VKKNLKRGLLLIVVAGLVYAIYYASASFPIISSYGAKNLCSCVFVAGRDEKNVKEEELGDFPLSIGTYKINYKDSSVTGTVFGFASQKAIFRKGLGCTLINDLSEKEIRAQHFVLPSAPLVNTDSIPWPAGDLIKDDSFPVGINRQRLQQVMQNVFEENDPKKISHTRAVVVLYDGKLVAEKYAPGYNAYSKMLGWSMTKSITGTLIGILVKDKKLKVEMPAPVPEWKQQNDNRHSITLEQLLQQTSGLKFEEDYSKASEATNMLFKRGDMAAFTASRPLQHKPGTVFSYSSGNSNILSRIVRQTVGEAAYHSFPANALFNKIGMYSVLMEPDASGTFIGSSFMYATARDWARFGLLYYNDGVWNGERILPEGWVKRATLPVSADPQKQYGYQFWLNGFDDDLSKRLYPDVPPDMYHADGYGGQEVYIIPSKKLVIVRLGLHSFDENTFLKNIISCLQAN
jgi:CubicO group peptidase (beta-lactamase class C family)